MRDTKFRAWDTEEKKMCNVLSMSFGEDDIRIIDKDGWIKETVKGYIAIPMQYTGLIDKNSEDIYEGDIVEVDYPNHTEMFIVIFDSGMFKAKRIDYEIESNGFSLCTITGERKCKIAGNIYENQKLLGKV